MIEERRDTDLPTKRFIVDMASRRRHYGVDSYQRKKSRSSKGIYSSVSSQFHYVKEIFLI